ncbi:MAG: coproporphyrinogen III oxidase, partial [Planctomycetota bacterium]
VLFEKTAKGILSKGDPDYEAKLYTRAWDFLDRAGFRQYEVSNFARTGFECIHNINTWKMYEWIGVGPSAASQYRGCRYSNVPDLSAWLKGLRSGKPDVTDYKELDPELLIEDAILFGLRMTEGISLETLESRWKGVDLSFLDSVWEELESAGWLKPWREGFVSLTPSGLLLADRIAIEIMSAFDAPK